MTDSYPSTTMGEQGAAADYRYTAFGMSIRSNLSLPELDRGRSEPFDLNIRLCSAQEPSNSAEQTRFEFGPDTQRLYWRSAGSFVIRHTSEIEINPAPDVGAQILHLPLLGPVMGLLLHLRGMMVLHASAVAVHGQGVGFLGNKGAGKSTLAAALIAAGHDLLADDLLAVSLTSSGEPSIVPGFPQLKLGPDVADAILERPSLPVLLPGLEKRQLRLTHHFSQAQARPVRMYILERGQAAHATPISPHEAFAALISFSYAGRFGKDAFGHRGMEEHFRQCALLAKTVPFARLVVPDRLADRLCDVVRLVEEELDRRTELTPSRSPSCVVSHGTQ